MFRAGRVTALSRWWILFLCLAPLAASAADDDAYMRELQTLQKKADACSRARDMECFNSVLQEMDALNEKYYGAMPSAAEPDRSRETGAAGRAEAAHADDPCYDVIAEKTYLKQTSGYEAKHIYCEPARAQLVWSVEETERHLSGPAWTDQARYVIAESYPAAVRLVYESPARRRLVSFTVIGPAPVGLYGQVKPPEQRVESSLRQVGGSIMLEPLTNRPMQRISINPGDDVLVAAAGDGWKGSLRINTDPELDVAEVRLSSSSVHFNRQKWAHVGYPASGILSGAQSVTTGSVTLEEMSRALRAGELVKKFPFEQSAYHDIVKIESRTEGEVALRLTLRPEPGHLKVSPTEGFAAIGPDESGRFEPSRKVYRLSNPGTAPIRFRIDKAKPWLTLSATSGELQPGQSQSLVVSVNERARTLRQQDKDEISFRNVTNGKGDTRRSVTVAAEQRWRVTVSGWDTTYFGSNLLAGGLVVRWQIVAEFALRGDAFRGLGGRAGFGKFQTHSQPPGVYDCQDVAKQMKRTAFVVNGSKRGGSVMLNLPANSYTVSYYCVMDSDQARDVLKDPEKYGMDSEARVRGAAQLKGVKEWQPLPQGRKTVPLKNGWQTEFGKSSSMDAHQIAIQRIR